MSQHTPGRLKLGRISYSEQSAEIDAESPTAWMGAYPWEGLAECRGCDENKTRGAAVMEANARRLVAAWNACDGISTNELETTGGAAVGWARTASKLIHATKQRDQLITALGACRDAMPPSAVDISEAIGYPTSVPAYVSESVAMLVAQRDELLAFAQEVRRSGDTRLASMAIAAIAKVQGGEA